jgi:hypothetical protein
MVSWLRCVNGKLCAGRILLAVTLLVSWNSSVTAQADDGPPKRNLASAAAAKQVAGDAAVSDPLYVVTYEAADILSQIQAERRLDAAGAKDFLRDRVKGPPVLQLNCDQHHRGRVEDNPRWIEEKLVVVANQPGHEQVLAMLESFRKFGVAEYAVSVRFITMTAELAQKAFPDSTSSALTTNQSQASSSEATPLAADIPPVHDGTPTLKVRTIVEEESPMRFRALDKDAAAKLLEAVNSDRRSHVLEAPLVTTFNGQTASVSDVARSRFVVGANLRPSGEYEPKTREVTEGTSMRFRPVAEPNGDIRLDFAATFTKIENVTDEELQIAPDKKIALRIPKVATCQVDGGAMLKPGQSLIFGDVKRLSEGRSASWLDKLLGRPPKREMQYLFVILRVEPFEIPRPAAAQGSSVVKSD